MPNNTKVLKERDKKPNDVSKLHMKGHVLIRDITNKTPVVLVDKPNAIHYGNMSFHAANSLGGKSNYNIHYMAFGNGGSDVSSSGIVTYKTPNILQSPDTGSAPTSVLYNLTFFKKINTVSSDPGSDKNKIEIVKSTSTYTDIKSTCTLDFGEPTGVSGNPQTSTDDATSDSATDYIFDELGLFSTDIETGDNISGDPTGTARVTFKSKCYMLSHVVFHPIQKSANRVIEVVYTLRLQMQ